MARKEAQTDLWVAERLKELGIEVCPQGSAVPDIDTALKTASKKGTGKPGFPEFTAVVKDFVLVVEDKADAERLEKLDGDGTLDLSSVAVQNFAVNGALHYALCIAENSGFRKVFAVGVAGNAERHRIKALFVDGRDGSWKELGELESFDCFGPDAIGGFYSRAVLGEPDPAEKTREELLKDAAELHELLRTYGSVKDQDKPLIVAGILLALDEIGVGSFKLEDLTGDSVEDERDGDKILAAMKARLRRSNVGPDAKLGRLLAEFQIFRTSGRLNEVHPKLKATPLYVYARFLYENVFHALKAHAGGEDFIGRFYGEFMSYSGGDGQTLGIVLTPAHVCSLMCDLVKLRPRDSVLDPACGTGGFLVESMRRMLADAKTSDEKTEIKAHRIHGFELQSNMFVAATSNMILHGDGQSNIACCDFLKQDPEKTREERKPTVGLMNPPYSQGTKSDPGQYELAFAEKLLDSLEEGGRAAVIVPQSSMTGKTKEERALKRSILKKHTLEGVITCNPGTFYGVGVQPVIAVFTAHEPHPEGHASKFIDFRDDGWTVRPHRGLVKDSSAAEKKARLLAVWNGNVDAPSRFCVKAAVGPDDEWLHGAHWFNDEIPSDADFEKVVGDYLTFEFSMVMQNREYLFKNPEQMEASSADA